MMNSEVKIGDNLIEIFKKNKKHFDDQHKYQQLVDFIMNNANSEPAKVKIKYRGKTFMIKINVLYNYKSKNTGKFITINDITERENYEINLTNSEKKLEMRNKELEKANQNYTKINKILINRELKMIELKKKIKKLEQ